MFREDFLLRARRRVTRVTDIVLTAPVNRITAVDIGGQLVNHYGTYLTRNPKDLRELIRFTLEGKPLNDLLNTAKQSHEKLKIKLEVRSRVTSRSGLEERAAVVLGGNSRIMIEGTRLTRLHRSMLLEPSVASLRKRQPRPLPHRSFLVQRVFLLTHTS